MQYGEIFSAVKEAETLLTKEDPNFKFPESFKNQIVAGVDQTITKMDVDGKIPLPENIDIDDPKEWGKMIRDTLLSNKFLQKADNKLIFNPQFQNNDPAMTTGLIATTLETFIRADKDIKENQIKPEIAVSNETTKKDSQVQDVNKEKSTKVQQSTTTLQEQTKKSTNIGYGYKMSSFGEKEVSKPSAQVKQEAPKKSLFSGLKDRFSNLFKKTEPAEKKSQDPESQKLSTFGGVDVTSQKPDSQGKAQASLDTHTAKAILNTEPQATQHVKENLIEQKMPQKGTFSPSSSPQERKSQASIEFD